MSAASAPVPAVEADPLARRLGNLLRNAPQRLRERPFWIIQFGVLAVTALHVLAELWEAGLTGTVHPALHHVPVILYLVPIAYASLRYGIEGAILTGLWCALLTLPNILIFHLHALEWFTEFVYVGAIIAAGVTMAVPVERERRQRQRAEATTRRLALLNEIATHTLTAGLDRTLEEALRALRNVLDLDAACVAAAGVDDPQRLVPIARQPQGEAGHLEGCLAELAPGDGEHLTVSGNGVVAVPFDIDLPEPGPAGRVSGVLAVQTRPGRSMTDDDHQLLVGVANQLAIALANSRMKDLERDRVRSYARLVTSAQEEERKRISRELHDETAQNLVAIGRSLDALSAELDDGRAPAGLHRLRELTSHTLSSLRDFSRDLRPPVLDDLGLPSALDSLVSDLCRRSELSIDLAVEGPPRRLNADAEMVLFRICQAALHNVERHAGASRAGVVLAFGPDRVRLTVTDDGRGFDLPDDIADLAAWGKLGLLGMQERAQLVGAGLELTSHPGAGTRVDVEVVG